ncbi:MAG: glycoside hydrolase family [Planctomycetota bacterium]|nr:MAG: glycoside hydrolase family [Planctomycetota bacterium]
MKRFAFLLALAASAFAEEPVVDVVLFDFESGSYDGWKMEGDAFGAAPATGSVPTQTPVSGFCGRRLANSFVGGDRATGRLLSKEFEITRPLLRFFVAGGDEGVSVRLLVDGETAFEAAGACHEFLRPVVWEVRKFRGKMARIEIVDGSQAGWGHILADHFMLTGDASTGPPVSIGLRRRIYDPREGQALKWALNDHCFLRDDGGQWHMFAITFTEPGSPEIDGQLLAHAVAPSLARGPWTRREDTLEIDRSQGETQLWAPHIVKWEDQYHLFYHAGGTDMSKARMHLAVSRDLKKWKHHDANPLFQDGFQARDPFVMAHDDRWWMWYTATFPAAGGHHTVAVRTSRDLRKWSESRDAFRDPRTGLDYGPTESPFVVHRGEYWYLFVGSSVDVEYVVTRVYRSRDPFNWTPADHVASLRVHGAEIVQDTDGRWYASHAGNGQGGLWLAPLYWNDGLDEEGKPFAAGPK